MPELTITDLRRIMQECAGQDESTDMDGGSLHSSFETLGYDSLALLEASSVIERSYGIKLPDDTVLDAQMTPGELLALVNTALTARTP
ncbi:act minimal PKS acyl carrier protein [Streptosporangium becharense]|uniref:Act minimal PKS acyl carrier protein n=1 Tax=Streptosporangium becharense TaxID=1816182 RepID=A0A7W9MK63_9ACTN|nr:acyl carrier protein [Streptosporangium becharense]MBB2910426.1 act minimal PKS acyl carrier protein [Streptosporangium becharense]MBB5823169.1 act minimal PKS acyl carrier protein [Streptosporangium becharense]